MKIIYKVIFAVGVLSSFPFSTWASMCVANIQGHPSQSLTINEPTQFGLLENPALIETSGLAASRLQADTFWAINDSGNSATLFALGSEGNDLGEWPLNARTYDWEDMSSVEVDGDPYLLVADVGDNQRNRFVYRVYVFSEPDINTPREPESSLTPVATIRFEYPDGSHNAEALSTDGEHIYLLTKASALRPEHGTSGLYRIPMTLTPGEEFIMAEYLGTMPNRSEEGENWPNGVDLLYPTAMEISQDNMFAHVLTYEHVLRFEREPDELWSEVILSGGIPVHAHSLTQAEALTSTDSGAVWFTTEDAPSPIWALPAP